MGGHAACWVKAKPNAFSGEKENAKDPPLRRRGNKGQLPNRQLALALLQVL